MLDFTNPYLEPASENSIELKGGKIRQTAHETGFDYQVFNKRSRCIQNYLRKASEGEVLQSDANIILTNDRELKYQKAGRYKRMELDAFIRRGMTLRRKEIAYFRS